MKRLTIAIGLVALAAVLAACSGASAAPTTSDAPAPTTAVPVGDTVGIVAKDLEFVQTEVAVPAGTPFNIDFDNQDGAPHNIAISDAAGAQVFKGEIVSGSKITYAIPALSAGTYGFICEVHPDMKGTITAN